jgi:uncharacterized protein (UPF0548 family)
MPLRRPAAAEIAATLAGLHEPFTYPEVAATRNFGSPLPRELGDAYDVDSYTFSLGTGRSRFEAAGEALFAWRHFEIRWLQIYGAVAPARPGQVVATLVGLPGFWWLNPCRVVWTHRPEEPVDSVGFAYGTLPGHAECGEERFVVSFDPENGRVTYEIAAFSRPATPLSKLGYPFARRLQRRFARASARALTQGLPNA